MIDSLRYGLGVISIMVYSAGLPFWYIIHPWARAWRRLGPLLTYLIVVPPMVAIGAVAFRERGLLLGADLGTNPILIAIAAILWVPMMWLEMRYWKHISIPTLVGFYELSSAGQRPDRFVQTGIYRIVRHPRYLSAGVGAVVAALFVNYTGLYLLVLVAFAVGFPILRLEERELIDRFGDAYREYQQEVPQLIPRLRRR